MEFAKIAKTYVGVKPDSTMFKSLIDYYNNNIKPLPRGYKVKYTDNYCATFASVIMKMGNGINSPFECSVQRMYNKAIQTGYTIKTPAVNDFIVYDWDSNNWLDHVGIISKVNKSGYEVIEGNYNGGINIRKIPVNYKYVAGFFRVPTSESISSINNSISNIDKVVNDVIKGKYGNGLNRKKNIENAGYNYAEIQKLVNQKLKG